MNTPTYVLYDGACPICQKQAAFFRRHDRHKRLTLVDIQTAEGRALLPDIPQEKLQAELHFYHPDERPLSGMPALCAAYRTIGIGWILAPTGWPIIKPLADRFYQWFARNRYRISRFFMK